MDGRYSFVFFSSDREEPMHIHVKRDDKLVKFCLSPKQQAKNRGFSANELRQIERLVDKQHDRIVEAWHEYFNL